MRKVLTTLFLITQSIIAGEIYATFDVDSIQKSSLTLTSTGIVKKIYVDIGSNVKKGDILLELDSEQENQDIELTKSNIDVAKLSLEHSNDTFNRYNRVKDVIDEEMFKKYEFDKNLRAKELNRSQKELKLKEIVLSKTKLYAPYSGVITDKFIEIGDGVHGTDTRLFSMLDSSNVKLILSFDEKYWKNVKVGDRFIYKVDGDDKEREGKISKIYPIVESSIRKIKAEVLTKDILVGLFGDGKIITE